MKAIAAVFDNDQDVENVLAKLQANGFDSKNIETVINSNSANSSGLSPEGVEPEDRSESREGNDAADPANRFPATPIGVVPAAIPGGIVGIPNMGNSGATSTGYIPAAPGFDLKARLQDLGIDEEDADYFARTVKREGVLLVVKADRDRLEQAAEIMRDANGKAPDVHDRGGHRR